MSWPNLVRTLEAEDRHDDLCRRLGYTFENRALLTRALSHRSWCSENGGVESNERLEYLGDSVLGLSVTQSTFHAYAQLSEGGLAKIRASVVNATVLAEVALEYGIGDSVLLGIGEESSGGRQKTSILCDAFEAIIGAVYLDGGWEPANTLVTTALVERVAAAAMGPGGGDFKTLLQEVVAKLDDEGPVYTVVGEGLDHEMRFTATVSVGGSPSGLGEGRTKKQAEQAAARHAWSQLRELETDED